MASVGSASSAALALDPCSSPPRVLGFSWSRVSASSRRALASATRSSGAAAADPLAAGSAVGAAAALALGDGRGASPRRSARRVGGGGGGLDGAEEEEERRERHGAHRRLHAGRGGSAAVATRPWPRPGAPPGPARSGGRCPPPPPWRTPPAPPWHASSAPASPGRSPSSRAARHRAARGRRAPPASGCQGRRPARWIGSTSGALRLDLGLRRSASGPSGPPPSAPRSGRFDLGCRHLGRLERCFAVPPPWARGPRPSAPRPWVP